MNNFNNFGNSLNVINNFSSILNFDLFHQNIISFINCYQLRNVDDSFDYFLNEYFDWHCFFDYLFNCNNFLSDYFNLSVFNNWDMDNLLNDSWLFYFNYFLSNDLLCNKFWNLDNSVYDFLNNSWHFNNSLCFSFDNDDLVVMDINIFDDFNWNMNYFFNFNYLSLFNDFFHYFLNRYDLWNFNNSVNYFLHYFFNFDDLGDDSENFKNIININDIHNLSVNHTNDSFIDVKNCTGLKFKFL